MKRNNYNYENFHYTSDSCLILMSEVRYKKNDFGEMVLVPEETKEEVVSPTFYTNYITAIPFFDNDFFALMLLVKLNGIEHRQELCLL